MHDALHVGHESSLREKVCRAAFGARMQCLLRFTWYFSHLLQHITQLAKYELCINYNCPLTSNSNDLELD